MVRLSRKLGFLLLVLCLKMVLADGAQYLVITHDNFSSAIQPLADWRQRMGMLTRVTKLSEISPQTRDGIRNYIITAYNTWSPRPEYVLLVGDTYYIPVGQTSPLKSDNHYANMDNQYRAELAVGRFPCRTVTECQTMVAKTLGYERTPLATDTAWYRKGLVAVRFDNAGDTLGYYVRDLRYFTNTLRDSAGFAVDSLFWRDNKGWHGQGPDSVRKIIEAVNDGRNFVLFRGFGTDDGTYHGWNIPMNARPENMSNGFRLPIVYGGCCQTVFAPGGRGVGEAWFRAGTATTPKGAVAYLGNSFHALASPWRSKVIQGFYKALLIYDSLAIGKALFSGKDSLYRWMMANGHPDTLKDSIARYTEQSLVGDPGLQVWTDYPRAIQVQHPAEVTPGPCSLRVVVTRSGAPVAKALVCAWKGSEFYAWGQTASDGTVDLSISGQTPGQFYVTVTGQNLRPYEGTCDVILRDVGITAITTPSGTVDSGTTVTPACTVANFGTTTESYQVRMRIGAGYDNRAPVMNHLPGSRVAVSLPAWTALARGEYALSCSTELAADMVQTNDRHTGSVFVRVKDVGTTVLLTPSGTLDSGAVVTPACTVRNCGNSVVSYEVRMRIGADYDQAVAVADHGPGEDRQVTFPEWTARTRGPNAVICSTGLGGDVDPTNDARTGSVTVGVSDVGAVAITAPAGTVDTNTSVIPKATVRNFGTTARGFKTQFRIGAFYTDSIGISSLNPGDSLVLSFKSWKALQRGTHAVSCTTVMAGDLNPANDRTSGTVTVRVIDVTCTKLVAPGSTVDTGAIVTPKARVKNCGTEPASFPVRFSIASVYSDAQNVTSLNPGESLDVVFAAWTANAPRGSYSMKCTTSLTGDKKAGNNRKTGSFTLRVKDVGAVAIVAPVGTIDSGISVIPVGQVANYGNTRLSFTVRFKIGTFYNKSRSKTVDANSTDTAAFPAWAVTRLGTHATQCSTYLAGDVNPTNSRVNGTVTVQRPAFGCLPNGTILLLAPGGELEAGRPAVPRLSVSNTGAVQSETRIRVVVRPETGSKETEAEAAAVYDDCLTLKLDRGAAAEVVLAPWTPVLPGAYGIVATADFGCGPVSQIAETSASVSVRREGQSPGPSGVMAGGEVFISGFGFVVRPNPMRDEAVVSYSLPVAGPVVLRLYDVAGNSVRTMAGSSTPGVRTVTIRTSGLPKGVYILELSTGPASLVRKLAIE